LDVGEITESDLLVPIGDNHPVLSVEVVDDVKTVLVKDRADRVAGLGIPLSSLPSLKAGDRITVTGRVPRETPAGSWGVALVTEESDARNAEECQLAQYTSPKVLFALSHILCGADLDKLIMVQTTRWGAINPIMDLYIDSIIVCRDEKYTSITEDSRTIVYSMDSDDETRPGEVMASADTRDVADFMAAGKLIKSGNPDVKIFMQGNSKALYIASRVKDWDGIDINMHRLELFPGNKYQIKVVGCIDGTAPGGTIITLQGIPGFLWRNNQQVVSQNQGFTLRYTLNHAEVEQWSAIRVTTNLAGASVPFYIYSIEIKRVGLL